MTYEIGDETQSTEVTGTGLSGLRLLLTTDDGDKRNVDEGEVLVAHAELELAHGLDERSRLDVTDGTTKLDNAHIRLLPSLVHGTLRDALDPVLDSVREVRDNLDSLAKVVTATLHVSTRTVRRYSPRAQ